MTRTEPGTSYGYQYDQFFGPNPTIGRLPRTPPPALSIHFEPWPEDECRCPFCETDAWYRQSPACKYWRADCELCHGSRAYYRWIRKYVREGPLSCDTCQHRWREHVRRFKQALTDPGQRVRETERQRRVLLKNLYKLDPDLARRFENCHDNRILVDLLIAQSRPTPRRRR